MWRLVRVLLDVVVAAPAASATPHREPATLLAELWETVLETPVPSREVMWVRWRTDAGRCTGY